MSEESSEDIFLKRLVEYMNKRYEEKGETGCFFKKYSATTHPVRTPDGKKRNLRWEVAGGGRKVPEIREYSDGEVFVIFNFIDVDILDDGLLEAIGKMLMKTIRGYWDMDPDERFALVDKEYEDVLRKLPDRSSWDELKQKYMGIISWLEYCDEIAREASEKTGIETVHLIFTEGRYTTFYSHFNSSGMSCDEVMERIERALDAIDIASSRVDLYPLPTHEEFKKRLDNFHEFCKRKGYIKPR